ncbi:metallophosphoesterase family protein [Paenisporosarcina cavernae]|uniref:Metallophosphoesterase n=1 Tax=Paenisporosarcina cavernae TaxID=2320858 RepID=A0A385YZ71_9BACL|nr:metallophosphoesterase family protein [Paenisporosarcina cavernae]AYC30652.1 metallophosphoesterase [Paenisporosarcina cavernae]
MKIAIMTDIHGNLEALQAVMDQVKSVESIFVLGDMIAMGPNSNEVMALLREDARVHMITGNHDEAVVSLKKGNGHPASYVHTREHHKWVASQLEQTHADYLDALPRERVFSIDGMQLKGIHYHIPEYKKDASILEEPFADIVGESLDNVQSLFGDYEEDVICFGHHHPVHFFQDHRHVYLNPGALGVGKDDKARFAIVEGVNEKVTVSLQEVPYDKETFLRKMETYDVPQREVMLRLFY